MQNNEARRRSSPPQRFLPSLGATRTRRRTRSFAGTCHTLQNRLPGSPLDASRGATRDDSACSSVFHSGEPIERLGGAEGGSYSNEPSAFLNNQGGCELRPRLVVLAKSEMQSAQGPAHPFRRPIGVSLEC